MLNLPTNYIFIAVGFLALILIFVIIVLTIKIRRKRKINRMIRKLAQKAPNMSPKEFFKERNQKLKETKTSSEFEFEGVYVIYNITRFKYYVGQATKIYSRVNNHFTGKGNGDVYADYKYKNLFMIQLLPLKNSGFKTLNELEREAIAHYKAYKRGYNKTKGNAG